MFLNVHFDVRINEYITIIELKQSRTKLLENIQEIKLQSVALDFKMF